MKDEKWTTDTANLAEAFDGSARPILTVDVEKYQSWLDESGLEEEQKEEFLRAVWSVVVTFVELGFGVHPLQEVGGKAAKSTDLSPKEAFDQVESGKATKPKT